MPDVGFIDGRFMPLAEAKIPVEDRGYQFADGVYEVIRTYRGVPFQVEAHLSRLERSAKAIGLPLPFSTSAWSAYVSEGIHLAGHVECKVYIQLTRGVAPRDHSFPTDTPPTAVMTVREMTELAPSLRAAGVDVITVDDLRWGRCDIKSINLLPNVIARQQAREAGAFEAIFVRNGEVSEGAVSNVMAVRSGIVVTPASGPGILSGVTRAVVLELARKEGIPVEERTLSADELRSSDEIFLTGTTVEVLSVVRVDQASVGSARPGEIANLLSARFRGLVS